jgi:hypothetical protein
MTLFTTISVATPSVTLMMEASAINRVRRYRHDNKSLYIANPWQFFLVCASVVEVA